MPVIPKFPADRPRKVLLVPKLWMNGVFPTLTMPAELAVTGSVRLTVSVNVPAEKLPLTSRRTMAFPVLVDTALVTTVVP